MKVKTLVSLFLLALLVPQVALAAWWNPFSWFRNNQPQTQTATEENVQTTTTFYTKYDNTRVRTCASFDCGVSSHYPQNTQVVRDATLETLQEWVELFYDDKSIGYIHKSTLSDKPVEKAASVQVKQIAPPEEENSRYNRIRLIFEKRRNLNAQGKISEADALITALSGEDFKIYMDIARTIGQQELDNLNAQLNQTNEVNQVTNQNVTNSNTSQLAESRKTRVIQVLQNSVDLKKYVLERYDIELQSLNNISQMLDGLSNDGLIDAFKTVTSTRKDKISNLRRVMQNIINAEQGLLSEYQSKDLEFYGKYNFDKFISDTNVKATQDVNLYISNLETDTGNYNKNLEEVRAYISNHPELQ